MSLTSPYVLLAVALLLVILVLSLYARHLATKDVRLFTQLAKRRKGKVVIDSFTSWATLAFPHADTEVTLFQRKGIGGKRMRTCIKCNLNLQEALSLHIAQGISGQTSVKELGQWFLVPQVQIGSEKFNKLFVVHGNDRTFLQRIISSDLQKRFIAMSGKDPTLYLHAQKQSFYRDKQGRECKHLLEFSIDAVPTTIEELEALLDDGLLVIDKVLQFSE